MLKNLFESKGLSENTIEKYKLGYDPNFEIEKDVFAEVTIIPNNDRNIFISSFS